jgi:hypothetical protein
MSSFNEQSNANTIVPSMTIDLSMDNYSPPLDELKSQIENSFTYFPIVDDIYDPSIFQIVLETFPHFRDTESFMIIDANHSIRKLKHWHNLIPRIKPFFGKYNIYMFIKY